MQAAEVWGERAPLLMLLLNQRARERVGAAGSGREQLGKEGAGGGPQHLLRAAAGRGWRRREQRGRGGKRGKRSRIQELEVG